MIELKPCPFCGCDAIIMDVFIPSYEGENGYFQPSILNYWVECKCCHVATMRYDAEIMAVRMWNRRTKE